MDDATWERLDPLIRKGESITAIRDYRTATGSDLREAKRAVEARIAVLFPPPGMGAGAKAAGPSSTGR